MLFVYLILLILYRFEFIRIGIKLITFLSIKDCIFVKLASILECEESKTLLEYFNVKSVISLSLMNIAATSWSNVSDFKSDCGLLAL